MKAFSCSCCILLSLVIFINADGIVEHKALREKCRDETKLTDDDIKMSATISSNLGCYLFCFLKDLQIMNDKGMFDPSVAVNAIEEGLREASKPAIYACSDLVSKNESNGDDCETAWKLISCFKERAPNLYDLMGILQPPM
ncbi:hypothetical protein PV326_011885 [Microctonus aethiopoides]|uniref:Uncharacterized protein n=1 Tax=Microctonus aethiopoides TaxID=144406 RepID=A0AA39EZ64_9HYME|nr:hypothetical protein PV326_011885 [Microctonus aethiopoides]KAK0158490.1 hypothetical protein PV328_009487 [Microctonus aethiopoides]